MMPRLVSAALLCIGIESLLGGNANAEVFEAMFNMKIFWFSGVILTIGLGIAGGGLKGAWFFRDIRGIFVGRVFLSIFLAASMIGKFTLLTHNICE